MEYDLSRLLDAHLSSANCDRSVKIDYTTEFAKVKDNIIEIKINDTIISGALTKLANNGYLVVHIPCYGHFGCYNPWDFANNFIPDIEVAITSPYKGVSASSQIVNNSKFSLNKPDNNLEFTDKDIAETAIYLLQEIYSFCKFIEDNSPEVLEAYKLHLSQTEQLKASQLSETTLRESRTRLKRKLKFSEIDKKTYDKEVVALKSIKVQQEKEISESWKEFVLKTFPEDLDCRHSPDVKCYLDELVARSENQNR